MTFWRNLMFAFLHVPFGFRKITGTGPFGPRGARYVGHLQKSRGNRLKDGLIRHHVKQFSESSCSVASVATVINALGEMQDRRFRPVTQREVLDRVTTGHWKARMSSAGHNGRRGLPLNLLGRVVADSLDTFGISYRTVETVAFSVTTTMDSSAGRTLRRRLAHYEERGNGVVIAHFDQGVFVRALNIPHISPVGEFDAESGAVTVIDVDPSQRLPYRISFDTFCRGLSSNYHQMFRPFGYGSGGYVYVQPRLMQTDWEMAPLTEADDSTVRRK